MIAAKLSLELLMMMCLGIFVQKIHLVKEDFVPQLTSFMLNIILPCVVIHSMASEEFSPETLKNCAVALVLSTAVCAIQLGLGQAVYLLSGKSGSGRIARYGMTFGHFSFMGIPIMEALFGNIGTLYYSIFLIPIRILYYGTTKTLLSPPEAQRERISGRQWLGKIFSPALVAVILGLILWVSGWKLPEVLSSCITSLARTCSPLGLILCGLVLGKYDFRKLLNIRYIRLPLIRLLVLPAIFFLLSRLMILTGIDPVLAQMTVIYAALPISALTAAFTVLYEPDLETQFEASGSVLIATLLSAATIPLWYWILQTF